MSDGRIERCRRCGARGAEAPDGFAVFASRNLFGPKVEADLCSRCFAQGMWEKWRFLIALASLVFVGYSAWSHDWLGMGVAAIVGGGWWWFSSRSIARLAAEPITARGGAAE